MPEQPPTGQGSAVPELADGGTADPRPGRGFEVAAVLVAYVLPLTGLAVVLLAAHLALIAVALLTVEALVVLAIVIARRRPPRSDGMGPPSRQPWLTPVIMVSVVGAVIGVAVLAASGP